MFAGTRAATSAAERELRGRARRVGCSILNVPEYGGRLLGTNRERSLRRIVRSPRASRRKSLRARQALSDLRHDAATPADTTGRTPTWHHRDPRLASAGNGALDLFSALPGLVSFTSGRRKLLFAGIS